jgi:hypothetical protein
MIRQHFYPKNYKQRKSNKKTTIGQTQIYHSNLCTIDYSFLDPDHQKSKIRFVYQNQ